MNRGRWPWRCPSGGAVGEFGPEQTGGRRGAAFESGGPMRITGTGEKNGTPERTRIPNLLIRSQALYPIELRALWAALHARAGKKAHRKEDVKDFVGFFHRKNLPGSVHGGDWALDTGVRRGWNEGMDGIRTLKKAGGMALAAGMALGAAGCSGGFGGTDARKSPSVINVSSWDPKERQRAGSSYSPEDLRALRRNGAVGFIARSAKGPALDEKFPRFLAAADRAGLELGAYHFVTKHGDPAAQADAFVNRVRAVARAKGISRRRILLVGDFDTASTPDRLVRFIERVEQRTGVTPVVYLENSDGLRARLRSASPRQKRVMRRAPYWLALYGPGGTERTMRSAGALTPDRLARQYGVWKSWDLWQYGGVAWRNGRSTPLHYNTSRWRSPKYFGDMAHPLERSVFRGGERRLHQWWNRHGMKWW